MSTKQPHVSALVAVVVAAAAVAAAAMAAAAATAAVAAVAVTAAATAGDPGGGDSSSSCLLHFKPVIQGKTAIDQLLNAIPRSSILHKHSSRCIPYFITMLLR